MKLCKECNKILKRDGRGTILGVRYQDRSYLCNECEQISKEINLLQRTLKIGLIPENCQIKKGDLNADLRSFKNKESEEEPKEDF